MGPFREMQQNLDMEKFVNVFFKIITRLKPRVKGKTPCICACAVVDFYGNVWWKTYLSCRASFRCTISALQRKTGQDI
jgi:hypothetical protein